MPKRLLSPVTLAKALKKPKQAQKLPLAHTQNQPSYLTDGLNHILQIDPTLHAVITREKFTQFDSRPVQTTNEAFLKLVWTVIGQQISGKAAKSIENKFIALFSGGDVVDKDEVAAEGRGFSLEKITPAQVLEREDTELRECGLSARKIGYVKHISGVFNSGDITIEFLNNASDQEIIDKLVELKGIGEWSARMFLIFALHRPDVFTALDLGVARGFSKYISTRLELLDSLQDIDWSLYKSSRKAHFDNGKKRDWKVYHEAQIDKFVEQFAPFRSVFMLVLWRLSSTELAQF